MNSLVTAKTNMRELIEQQDEVVHSLIEYLEYCQCLEFMDEPDYRYLAKLIQ